MFGSFTEPFKCKSSIVR